MLSNTPAMVPSFAALSQSDCLCGSLCSHAPTHMHWHMCKHTHKHPHSAQKPNHLPLFSLFFSYDLHSFTIRVFIHPQHGVRTHIHTHTHTHMLPIIVSLQKNRGSQNTPDTHSTCTGHIVIQSWLSFDHHPPPPHHFALVCHTFTYYLQIFFYSLYFVYLYSIYWKILPYSTSNTYNIIHVGQLRLPGTEMISKI